jgi:phage shock protein PspC (stress-responsive transcriptional regulator)
LRALRRSRSDRKVAGVCGGLGAYLDIDPLVFRITTAVLSIFGGVGVLLYGLAWLLVPEEGAEASEGERLIRGRADSSAIAAILAVIVGVSIFGGFVSGGFNAGALVLMTVLGVGIIVAVRQGGRTHPEVFAPSPPRPAAQPGAYGQTTGTAYSTGYAPPPGTPQTQPGTPWTPPPAYWQPPFGSPVPPMPTAPPVPPPPLVKLPPRPARDRSWLGGATVSLALITIGTLVALDLQDVVSVGVAGVTAAVLLVLGAGLVLGAWAGRARGLIAAGTIATLVLVAAASVDVSVNASAGDRLWEPTSISQLDSPYELGAGEAILDLTALPLDGSSVPVEASVTVGRLLVRVPAGADLDIDAHVAGGEIRFPDGTTTSGLGVDRRAEFPAAGAATGTRPTLRLDLNVGLGQVEVIREAA